MFEQNQATRRTFVRTACRASAGRLRLGYARSCAPLGLDQPHAPSWRPTAPGRCRTASPRSPARDGPDHRAGCRPGRRRRSATSSTVRIAAAGVDQPLGRASRASARRASAVCDPVRAQRVDPHVARGLGVDRHRDARRIAALVAAYTPSGRAPARAPDRDAVLTMSPPASPNASSAARESPRCVPSRLTSTRRAYLLLAEVDEVRRRATPALLNHAVEYAVARAPPRRPRGARPGRTTSWAQPLGRADLARGGGCAPRRPRR